MNRCPACGRQFPDDLRFCLEDGTLLTAAPEEETQFARVSTGNRRRGAGKLGIVVAAVLLLAAAGVIAAGVAGAYFYLSSRGSSDKPGPPEVNYPASSNRNGDPATSANKAYPPTPSPSRTTPSPTPAKTSTPAFEIKGDITDTPEEPENKKPTRPMPKQISGGVLNGKATFLPKPPYPPAARAVRASGAVNVQVLVDESGNVASASAVSGHPLLRAAAVSAARSARFAPTLLAGQPVKVSGVIVYNFVP